MSNSQDAGRSPWFMPLIFVGGLVFGFGLGFSQMARPEVVLDFLQFDDLGLLFVMGGAAVVTGVTFTVAMRWLDRAPLTGDEYTRRLKSFDRNVLVGGGIFGVGWGLSGICPGAAYASLGIGISRFCGGSSGCSSARTPKGCGGRVGLSCSLVLRPPTRINADFGFCGRRFCSSCGDSLVSRYNL